MGFHRFLSSGSCTRNSGQGELCATVHTHSLQVLQASSRDCSLYATPYAASHRGCQVVFYDLSPRAIQAERATVMLL